MLPQEKELYGQGVIVKVNEAKGLVRLHNRVGTRITIEDHQFDGVRCAYGGTPKCVERVSLLRAGVRPYKLTAGCVQWRHSAACTRCLQWT